MTQKERDYLIKNINDAMEAIQTPQAENGVTIGLATLNLAIDYLEKLPLDLPPQLQIIGVFLGKAGLTPEWEPRFSKAFTLHFEQGLRYNFMESLNNNKPLVVEIYCRQHLLVCGPLMSIRSNGPELMLKLGPDRELYCIDLVKIGQQEVQAFNAAMAHYDKA